MLKKLKVLYCYPYYDSPDTYVDVQKLEFAYIEQLRHAGFDVEPFCVTLDPPGPCLTFPDLDHKWRYGDKKLLAMYEKLEKALQSNDVLYNVCGINLHPEFVEKLPVFTVFQCGDDPENSKNLSIPAAHAYDLCLVQNIAEIATYKQRGIQNVEWIPLGSRSFLLDRTLTAEMILHGDRDIDLFMMSDKESPWRKERLELLANAFPQAHFYGRGWPRGFLPVGQELHYLRRAKIGPNIHNSTGPINFRTYYLPANGVMQLCDNKSHLAGIYELNKEVVGFDTMKECIELCRYYLAHDDERRQIAAAGWKRAMTDYNEIAVYERAVRLFEKYIELKQHTAHPRSITIDIARRQNKATIRKRAMVKILAPVTYSFQLLKRSLKFILRRTFSTIKARSIPKKEK
jgi:spore maturation protein CgeB